MSVFIEKIILFFYSFEVIDQLGLIFFESEVEGVGFVDAKEALKLFVGELEEIEIKMVKKGNLNLYNILFRSFSFLLNYFISSKIALNMKMHTSYILLHPATWIKEKVSKKHSKERRKKKSDWTWTS